MRRIVLFPVLLLLPLAACGGPIASTGNPVAGFGRFFGDTAGFGGNPNQPPGNSETVRRVEGASVTVPPLLPEPGNVWPGAPKPLPTLSDFANNPDQMTPLLPLPKMPALSH